MVSAEHESVEFFDHHCIERKFSLNCLHMSSYTLSAQFNWHYRSAFFILHNSKSPGRLQRNQGLPTDKNSHTDLADFVQNYRRTDFPYACPPPSAIPTCQILFRIMDEQISPMRALPTDKNSHTDLADFDQNYGRTDFPYACPSLEEEMFVKFWWILLLRFFLWISFI